MECGFIKFQNLHHPSKTQFNASKWIKNTSQVPNVSIIKNYYIENDVKEMNNE